MNAKAIFHGLRTTALALIAGVLVSAPSQVYAATHGSVGGAVHGGGFGGYHGGYGGGYRGGYGGYRGGYYGRYGYGWRGGWGYGYGGWGWWGWPLGGLFLATLPFYYSTSWWNGVPYYYADDNYYIWSNSQNGYVSVTPPPQIANQGAAPAGSSPAGAPYPYPGAAAGTTDLFVYPKNSQSAQQIAQDRQECQAWAASQAGAGAAPTNRSDNLRAQTACLEARGYSVK